MSPYTKRRFWMPKRPQVSSRWCSCCIRRSSFAIIKRLAGVVVLMVVGGELQIQSLPTDRLSPWQTYVLVGCINETLLLSWFHNRVNFTSVIWCMCHSIIDNNAYHCISPIIVCICLISYWFWVGQIHFCCCWDFSKDELYIYKFFTCSFQMKNPSTWVLKRPSNLHQVMPSNAGERSEGAGWGWSCCCCCFWKKHIDWK